MSAPGAEFDSCRIRAKRLGPGDKCLFCLLVNDGLNPEVVLAMVYVMAPYGCGVEHRALSLRRLYAMSTYYRRGYRDPLWRRHPRHERAGDWKSMSLITPRQSAQARVTDALERLKSAAVDYDRMTSPDVVGALFRAAREYALACRELAGRIVVDCAEKGRNP